MLCAVVLKAFDNIMEAAPNNTFIIFDLSQFGFWLLRLPLV